MLIMVIIFSPLEDMGPNHFYIGAKITHCQVLCLAHFATVYKHRQIFALEMLKLLKMFLSSHYCYVSCMIYTLVNLKNVTYFYRTILEEIATCLVFGFSL